MDTAVLDDIHDYWFGPLPAFDSFPEDKADIWFAGTEAVDRDIAERFAPALEQAVHEPQDLTGLTPAQLTALVVLFDQFPRNIFRGSAQSHAYDARARALARRIVENGLDDFKLVERSFISLPFLHGETLADQDFSRDIVAQHITPYAPEGNHFYDYGRKQIGKYRDIIARFGRFPHRNDLLARASTPEELSYLEEQKAKGSDR